MLSGSLPFSMYFQIGIFCSSLLTLANPGHALCANPPSKPLEGCPMKIPVVDKENTKNKILAGRVWNPTGGINNPDNTDPQYKIPELGCRGQCYNWYGNTKTDPVKKEQYVFVSVMINPGCTLHVFETQDFTGSDKTYIGPQTIINPNKEGPIHKCSVEDQYKNMPCVGSMIWSCNQTLPHCTFTDDWQTIAIIDNLKQTESVQFTYEKVVGTTFSEAIKNAKSVSGRVSATLSAEFFAIAASLGAEGNTGYDWEKLDSESKSESRSYNVNVKVSGNRKIFIQEVVGTCKGVNVGEISTIHTQSFRVVDEITGNVLQKYNGRMTKYNIPAKKGTGKGKGKG